MLKWYRTALNDYQGPRSETGNSFRWQCEQKKKPAIICFKFGRHSHALAINSPRCRIIYFNFMRIFCSILLHVDGEGSLNSEHVREIGRAYCFLLSLSDEPLDRVWTLKVANRQALRMNALPNPLGPHLTPSPHTHIQRIDLMDYCQTRLGPLPMLVPLSQPSLSSRDSIPLI